MLMLPQLMNIIAGFMLASPKLKVFGGETFVEKMEMFLYPYRVVIGWIALIVGVVTLVDRVGITDLLIGDSYPQAIPAILIGLITLSEFFEKNHPAVHDIIRRIEPYGAWIGIWGIAAGLVSILFGCPFCYY